MKRGFSVRRTIVSRRRWWSDSAAGAGAAVPLSTAGCVWMGSESGNSGGSFLRCRHWFSKHIVLALVFSFGKHISSDMTWLVVCFNNGLFCLVYSQKISTYTLSDIMFVTIKAAASELRRTVVVSLGRSRAVSGRLNNTVECGASRILDRYSSHRNFAAGCQALFIQQSCLAS